MAPTEDVEILRQAAEDGTLEYKWPVLVEQVLQKLDHIVHNEFPIPSTPPPEPTQAIQQLVEDISQSTAADCQGESSEHRDVQFQVPGNEEQPSTPSPPRSQSIIPNSQPSDIPAPPGTLPPKLLSFYSGIQSALRTSFSTAPPFTIQRLSELLLHPREHYKTLPSYLRALDRVMSVSSTADIFPLPSLTDVEGESANYLASGSISQHDDFNGAALTRIPWLKDTASMVIGSERPLGSDLRTESTSMIDGPNGAGSIETVTVSVNGFPSITAAEIGQPHDAEEDRMEEDAVPDNDGEEGSSTGRSEGEADPDHVHARGPEVIGMEDMGPQATRQARHVFDAEAALGRPGESERAVSPNPQTAKEDRDADGDTVVADITEAQPEPATEQETDEPSES